MKAEQALLSNSGPAPAQRTPEAYSPRRAQHARDAAPFIAWVESRIVAHNEREERHARERGLRTTREPGGLERLLSDIGWLGEGERKRLWRWRNRKPGGGAYLDENTGAFMVPAEEVEAGLEHADVAVWELYPDDEEGGLGEDVFCPVCSDEVTSVDGACPWCGAELARRPHSGARGGRPKSRRGPRRHTKPRRHKRASLAGLQPAPRPDPIAMLQSASPEQAGIADRQRGMTEPFVREAMRVYLRQDLSVLDAARVLFERYPGRWSRPESTRCGLVYSFQRRGVLIDGDRRTIRHRPDQLARERALIETYLNTRGPGYAYSGPIPPEAVWEAAWRYYIDGYGFLRIARLLIARWPWITRSSERSFCSTLYSVFRVNGWPTRPQREATAAANYRHGMTIHRDKAVYNRYRKRKQTGIRPHCDEVSKATGRPCGSFAMHGDTKCWSHSRRTQGAREKALHAGRRAVQRELVDSAPFVAWLRGRVSTYGSQRATSPIVGLNRDTLSKILKTGGTSTPGKVTRRLIEQTLEAALRNDPNLVVPRFTDLYDTRESDPEQHRIPER